MWSGWFFEAQNWIVRGCLGTWGIGRSSVAVQLSRARHTDGGDAVDSQGVKRRQTERGYTRF